MIKTCLTMSKTCLNMLEIWLDMFWSWKFRQGCFEASAFKGTYPEFKHHLISKSCSKFQKVCQKIIICDAILQVNMLLYKKKWKKLFSFFIDLYCSVTDLVVSFLGIYFLFGSEKVKNGLYLITLSFWD